MILSRAKPLRWSTAVVVVVMLLVLVAPRSLGGPTSFILVAGSSMSPTFEDGDLVVVREGEYAVGDVVAFETGRGVVIHRIIGGDAEDGFVLKGDNRNAPDTWRPTADEVLGKRLFHIPGAGNRVRGLMGNPMMLGSVLGGLGTLMVWKPARIRRNRRGAHQAVRSHRTSETPAIPTPRAGISLAVLAGLALLLGGLLVYLLLQPLERTVQVEIPWLEHTGTHRYVASVDPSVVYEGTTITSDSADGETTAIYTQLLNELHIEFAYDMSPHRPFEGEGAISSYLSVSPGENQWTRHLPLLPRRPFEGTEVSETFRVDIPFVLAMIERAERETGQSQAAYDLRVLTRVDLTGDGGGPGDTVFEAALPMQLSETVLTIENSLSASEIVTTTEDEVVPNTLDIAGWAVPVGESRGLVSVALAAVILVAVVYGLVVRSRLGSGEAARIRLLYGPLIVPVTGMSPNGEHRVEVESMRDLVKLARRAEQLVFYDNDDGQTFSVPDGAVVYQYRAEQPRRRSR